MKLKAYAKINLSLNILNLRPDGFHNLESVMQSVSLCDYITLTPRSSGIELTTNDSRLTTDNSNLAYKAAELFMGQGKWDLPAGRQELENGNKGIKIEIEKNIPIAAGLAGGSADAAAVLFGLNQLTTHDSRLTIHELLALAAQIGSDVPFCLTGGTCLVKGRGEILEKQTPKPKTYYVLVCPDIQVSTKWAYQAWDEMPNDQCSRFAGSRHNSIIMESGQMTNEGNALEAIVIKQYPQIGEIKKLLISLGCSQAQMSGSGSSVFGVAQDQAKAKDILTKIKTQYYNKAYIIETVDQGLEVVK